MKLKKKKLVTRSNISDKAKKAMQMKLKEQIKRMRRESNQHQVNRLNAMIMGMHGYYKIATLASLDFEDIDYIVNKSLNNRLKAVTKKRKVKGKAKKSENEPKKSKTFLKYYGEYAGKTKSIAGITIFPIYGCKFHAPMCFTQEINKYTIHGRGLIHDKLTTTDYLVRYLLNSKEYNKSVEYNDNRISLIAGQSGKCGVTGEVLTVHNMACHHKLPKELGGTDEYKNLVWLCTEVHELIHATQSETIAKYLKILRLDQKALKKVNSLRLSAENLEIIPTAI